MGGRCLCAQTGRVGWGCLVCIQDRVLPEATCHLLGHVATNTQRPLFVHLVLLSPLRVTDSLSSGSEGNCPSNQAGGKPARGRQAVGVCSRQEWGQLYLWGSWTPEWVPSSSLRAMASADLNQDGYGDLVVGVPGYSRPGHFQIGRVYLIYGNDLGLPPTDLDLDTEAHGSLEGFQVRLHLV